jgi:hypothetical protein
MLCDKFDGLTRVRNSRRSDSLLLACATTRIVARETGAGRNAALLGDGDGTPRRVRAERRSLIDAPQTRTCTAPHDNAF